MWEYIDFEELFATRDEEARSVLAGPYEVPVGMMALDPELEAAADPAAYVIDPDYIEILNLEPHELIKYRR